MDGEETNVEELQLIDCAADAGREEEHIALEPRHLDGGVLEASSGACVAHDGGMCSCKRKIR